MVASMKSLVFTTVAGALLATSASGTAVGEPFDQWFYLQTQSANVITWGGFNASTGEFLGEGVCADAAVSVNSLSVDRDPITQTLYVLGNNGVFVNDYAANRCALNQILSVSDLPASTVSLRGVSLNDAATRLYVLWYDGDSATYVISTVDLSTETIVDSLDLQSANLIATDAEKLALLDGSFYIASSDNRLWEFDAASGNELAVHPGPVGAGRPLGLDRAGDGLIHGVVTLDGQEVAAFTTFNPANSTWSPLVPTSYQRLGYTYVEADPVLAETGFDSAGFFVGSAALVAVGGLAVFRRRIRR
ncbi:MAG: hypothetical protein RLZZ587_30 [Actinomycetota bacterium]|jgi:hypothetical protein